MTYVISSSCIDTLDRTCVEVCAVACIYEAARKLYIQPDECVDCGACEPVCPVTAIAYVDDVPATELDHIDDNARFFSEPLPGRDAPLGLIGGARDVSAFGVDTPLVASSPPSRD